MNVNHPYGSITSSAVSSLEGIDATSSSSAPLGARDQAATASISSPAQFLNQMQRLEQQDPAAFQKVAAQVASTFQTAAGKASGAEGQLLANLAQRFSQASQTGSLATPPGMSAQGAGMPQLHHQTTSGTGFLSQSSAVRTAFQSALSVVDRTLAASST